MHRHGAEFLPGLVPEPFCTGSVRLLLAFSFVYPVFCSCNCAVATASRLAGAVREIGSDLRISPYLSNTSQPSLGNRCGGEITADRDGYRGIVVCDSGSLDSHTLQTLLLGIVRSFFIIGQGLCIFRLNAHCFFFITANRENGQFHVMCAGGLTTQAKPV